MPLFRRGSGGGGGGSGTVSGTVGTMARFTGTTVVGSSAFVTEDANGINVVGGNLNSTQGSLASMARGGAGHIGAICLNNTSGSRAETVLTGQALGTGDFSVYVKVMMPTALPTTLQYVWSLYDPGSSDCVFVNLESASGGVLRFQAKKTGETTVAVTIDSTTLGKLLGQVVGLGIKRSGNVCTFYVNGVSVGTITGNVCTVSYSATAKSQAGNITSSANVFLGNIYCNRIYNRSLSDADFAAIGSGGVDASDEYGSQTAVYASDFSAGIDGWSSARVTQTGNIDSIGSPSTSDTLQLVVDTTTSNTHITTKPTILALGKRYRFTGSYYVPAGNANVTGFMLMNGAQFSSTFSQGAAWQTFSWEFTATSTTPAIYLMSGVSSTFTGNGTDGAWFKGLNIVQVGCISAPAFNIGNGATLPDRSPNGLDSIITGGYTHTIPVRAVYTDNLKVTNDVVGNFGANDGNLPTAVRSGAGAIGGVYFNGVNGSHASGSITGQTPGTKPFSFHVRFRMPESAWAGSFVGLAQIGASVTAAGANSAQIYGTTTSDTLFMEFDGASSSHYRRWTLPASTRATYAGQIVDLMFTRDSTPAVACYLNGVSQTLTQTTVGTDPTAGADINPSTHVIAAPWYTTPFAGTIFNCRLFNRALTAAEAKELWIRGVAPSDEHGSQTAVYTQDTSAGVDGWAVNARASIAGNIDAIGSPSTDNVLRGTVDGTASSSHGLVRNSAFTAGKRYRVVTQVYIPIGQAVVDGILFQCNSVTLASASSSASWQTLTFEFVAGATSLLFYPTAVGSATLSGNGIDVFYLANTVITQIGCVVDADYSIGSGSLIPGRGSNAIDLTLAGGYQHTVPKRSVAASDRLTLGALGDWALRWVSAGVAAIRNGAAAQYLRLNGTWTDDSNQRYVEVGMSTAGVAKVNAKGIGTGVSGNVLELGAGDAVGLRLNSAGGAEGPLGTLTRTHSGDAGCILPSATGGSRVSTALARHTIGTGDFTISGRIEIPATNPSTTQYIASLSKDASNRIYPYMNTAGQIGIITTLAGSSTTFALVYAATANAPGSVLHFVMVRSGTTLLVYINGQLSFSQTDANMAVNFDNTSVFEYGCLSTLACYQNRLYNARLFRRALSASDVVNLMNKGVDPSDEWDNPTAIKTFDFSAGVDSLSATRGTGAGNIDAIGSPSTDDTYRFTVDSSASNTHYATLASGLLTVGKRYRITASIFIPTGQVMDGIAINAGGTLSSVLLSAGSGWQTLVYEFVAAATSVSINGMYGASSTFTGNGTDVFYIGSGAVITTAGCIVDWDLGTGVGLSIPDRSSNCYLGQGTGISHPRPTRYGTVTYCVRLLHSAISATAATTVAFYLPPGCGTTAVEVLRNAAMDSGVTIDVGVSGTPAKYASAMAMDATGLLYAASLSPGSESATADTTVYVKKSGATTVGDITLKITISIRG